MPECAPLRTPRHPSAVRAASGGFPPMKNHGLSRRGFLKASVLAGVAVYVAPIGSRAF
ncbi:twin-arginine translocation signal domain-containing protein, partial [Burkholderia sp. A2]|uniref:twin-arginine translocation signal domain-containing protein n=1 Tax=Burkholderia sp. A2 TaxID=236253 RepID=UPI00114D1C04